MIIQDLQYLPCNTSLFCCIVAEMNFNTLQTSTHLYLNAPHCNTVHYKTPLYIANKKIYIMHCTLLQHTTIHFFYKAQLCYNTIQHQLCPINRAAITVIGSLYVQCELCSAAVGRLANLQPLLLKITGIIMTRSSSFKVVAKI